MPMLQQGRKLSDEQLADVLRALADAGGNQVKAARALGLNRNTFLDRLRTAKTRFANEQNPDDYRTVPAWQSLDVSDGSIVISSDAHVWPFARSISARALIEITKALKPVALVANGDFVDGARNNRHDPDGWNRRPSVQQELEGVQALLHDWQLAAPHARLFYTLGNHEKNFDRKLVGLVKEYEGVPGFRLEDHLHPWPMSLGVKVNWGTNDAVCIKHRFPSGGVHAGYNATLKGGVTTVSGHTHLLEVKPWGDYRGRRWGVQTGCLTDPTGPQFEYDELNPRPHCEGFAVLTFRDGQLLPPELCEVIRGRAWFRGEVWAEAEDKAA